MQWGRRKALLGLLIISVFLISGCSYPGRIVDPGDLPALALGDDSGSAGLGEGSETASGESDPNPVAPQAGEANNSTASVWDSRANPAPTYERYSLPGWEIQVQEVLRGADAWAVVQADSPKNPALNESTTSPVKNPAITPLKGPRRAAKYKTTSSGISGRKLPVEI